MAQIAQNNHTCVVTLDGSACLKTPTGFFEYLSATFHFAYLDSREYANPVEPLYHADADHRIILTIDHFEQLKLIERLFINDFLPRLPDSGVAVILASRLPLPREWQTLSELGQKIVELPLAAFTYKETVDYVESYGAIEQEVIHKLIRLSSGLPLALALLTDFWSLHWHLFSMRHRKVLLSFVIRGSLVT
ncbi:hypothetical protein [Sporolactobacillus laevolacticus]|uniref:Uncharacterized protein n=1 Tax=Sporolactobacillus laevolacticus DSM 442 TaxID=1395513 RepID=V6IZ15_9BACL|nr:hypothetical protein [Sporolactobacillus laevolacticus]EST12768.1 hypothetical protein P343_05930 [Sporolactobacillus laevolacticus DSM 442]